MNQKIFISWIVVILTTRLAYSSLFPLRGENGEMILGLGTIDCAVFSPDNSLIASGGSLGVFLWDAQTGELRQWCETPISNRVQSIAFSPDGAQLAGSCDQSSICVWDSSDGRLRYFWNDPGATEGVLAYSPDGKQIAFGNDNGEIWILAAETGGYIRRFSGEAEDGRVFFLKFDSEARDLLVGFENIARLWDLQQERWIQSYSPSNWKAVDLSPDGRWVATGRAESIYLWDLQTGELMRQKNNIIRLVDLRFLPDNKTLLVRPLRNALFLDIDTLEERTDFHISSNSIMDFSKDSKTGLVEKNTGLALGNLETGETIREFPGYHNYPFAFDFSPEETEITVGYQGGFLYVWDLQTGAIRHILNDRIASFQSVKYSTDGKRILTAALGGDVVVWNREGIEQQRITTNSKKAYLAHWVDDDRILVLDADNELSLWSLSSSSLIQSVTVPLQLIDQLAVSPLGDAAAIHSDVGGYHVYSLPSFEEILSIPVIDYYDSIIGFTPDGRNLVIHARSVIQIWSLETKEMIDQEQTQTGWIVQTQYSPIHDEYLSILGAYGSSLSSDAPTYQGILSNLTHEKDILIYQQVNLEMADAKVSPSEKLLATLHQLLGIRIWPLSRIPTGVDRWMLY